MELRRDDGASERIATDVEKIIIPADIRQLKYLRPDMGNQYLRFGLRLFTFIVATIWKILIS